MTVRKAGSVWDCDRFLSIVRREHGKSWLAKQAIMNWKGKSKAVDGWYRFFFFLLYFRPVHLHIYQIDVFWSLFSEKRTRVCTANLMSAKSNKAWGRGGKRKRVSQCRRRWPKKAASTLFPEQLRRDGLYHYHLHSFRLMDTDRWLSNQQHLNQRIQFNMKHG